MSWLVTQVKSAGDDNATFDVNVTAGSTLIAMAMTNRGDSTFISFSDNINGSWPTQDVIASDVVDSQTMAVAHFNLSAAGAITVSASTSPGIITYIAIHEFPDLGAFDVGTGRFVMSDANPSSGNTGNPSAANEMVFGAIYPTGGTFGITSTGAGYVGLIEGITENIDSGAIGPASAVFSISNSSTNCIVICAVYKANPDMATMHFGSMFAMFQ